MRCWRFVAFLTLLGFSALAFAQAGNIYWTDEGTL